jgi:hypothetical protein
MQKNAVKREKGNVKCKTFTSKVFGKVVLFAAPTPFTFHLSLFTVLS